MYRKALALTFFGFLAVAGATLLYGAMFDGGLGRSVAGLVDDGDRDRDGRDGRREERDDD